MAMDNIYKAQDYIKDFVAKVILPTYKFKDWKESLVLSRNKDQDALHKKWDIFGKAFVPFWIEPDIISAGDWVPALMLTYRWNVKDTQIPVRFTICNNEIQYVEITDMFAVAKHFGEDFDFIKEFEKSVVLIKLLSS
jgi:glycogen synthase